MNIAGIDFSTRAIDIVLVAEEGEAEIAWHRYDLAAAGDSFDRARTVRESMPGRSWWEDHQVVAVGIEDPRGYAAGHLYRVQGGILQCLPSGLLVQPWIPSAWRRRVGLPGNAPKAAVTDHVRSFVPVPATWPQDAIDAYCIARVTRDALERREAHR